MRQNHLFISYRRLDKAFVQQLDQRLKAEGREVWIDWEDIPPATFDFDSEIKQGIEEAQNFVAVLTPEYLQSAYCLNELEYAHNLNKRLIPIVYRPIDDKAVPPYIAQINWIFFSDGIPFEDALAKLRFALDTDLEHVDTHTRFLVRARRWENLSHDPSVLLRGNELKEAEAWLARAARLDPQPAPLHVDYIRRSRIGARRRQRINIIVSAVIMLIVALALLALSQERLASSQRDRALEAESQARDAEAEAVSERIAAEAAREDAIAAREVAQENALEALRQKSQADQARAQAEQLALALNALLPLNDDDTDLAVALGLRAAGQGQNELETGRTLATVAYHPGTRRRLVGHSDDVRAVAFLSAYDWLASASADGAILIWERNTGATLPPLTVEGANADLSVNALATSDDGLILAGYSDGTVRLWDATTQSLRAELSGHQSAIQAIAFTPNGDHAFSSDSDGFIIQWGRDANGAWVRIRVFSPARGITLALDADPEGRFLISGQSNGLILYWDLSNGALIRELVGHSGAVYSVALSPDAGFALSGGADGILRYWNLVFGRALSQFDDHVGAILSVDISSDGAYALSGGLDRTLRLWDLSEGIALQRLRGHNASILSLAFDPRANAQSAVLNALSGSADNTLRLWDLTNAAESQRFGFRGPIETLALAPNGERLLTGGSGGVLDIWDLAAGEHLMSLRGHIGELNAIAISSDSRQAISAATDSTLIVWDVETGAILHLLRGRSTLGYTSVAYLQDEARALSGSRSRSILLWDIPAETSSRPFPRDAELHQGSITALAVSTDKRFVASGDTGTRVVIWDFETGEPLRVLDRHTDWLRSLAFSPDGSLLLSGGQDGLIVVWDTATGRNLAEVSAHTGSVRSLAFDSSGQLVISGSADRTVRVWDVSTGLELRRFEGHTAEVRGVAFASGAKFGVSGALDGTMRVWRIDNLAGLIEWTLENRYLRDLSRSECVIFRIDPCSALVDFDTELSFTRPR